MSCIYGCLSLICKVSVDPDDYTIPAHIQEIARFFSAHTESHPGEMYANTNSSPNADVDDIRVQTT
jgi:hypothetical protein